MKITIVQGAFLPVPPLEGGAVEKIWYRMGQEFASLGHEVVHIGRHHADLPDQETLQGVQYVRVRGYDTPSSLFRLKWLDLWYSIRAVRQIPDDADVIVTNTFWAPFLLRGNSGRKVYVNVERVPKGQMKFYRHVGGIRGGSLAICAAIKREIAPIFHPLVSYVRNPVPFDVKPVAFEKEDIILFVGRLHPEKGVHVLLEAFALLQQTVAKDWKLVIVGPSEVKAGGGGEAYQQRVAALAKNLNVELVGPVYSEDVLTDYYARARVFCYPAQDGSGDAAPVAPREAMAYGCVPVVSQLECFNDLITNGKNGLTYNQNAADADQAKGLAQALSLLTEDQEALHRMAEEGRQVMHQYSPRVVAQEFVQDFEKIYSAKK